TMNTPSPVRAGRIAPPRQRSKAPISVGLSFSAAFCLLFAIVLGYLAFVQPVRAALEPAVMIQEPLDGTILNRYAPVPVQIGAAHPSAIKRVELYVDGLLTAAQDAG